LEETSAIRFELEGARELVKALRTIDRDLPKELQKIHKSIAEPVAEAARLKAPVGKTGRLKRSVKAYGTQRISAIGAGARLLYAGPIHYGWPAHNIVAQPFLNTTLTENQDSMINNYETELDDFIQGVWEQL